jgi:hypothetical protein
MLLILLIIILLFYIANYYNYNELFKNKKKKNIILLTMCVDTKSNKNMDKEYRLQLYKDTINKYLKNTNLEIFIIESSNNKELKKLYENNNRIHIHIFDLKKNKDLIKFNKGHTLYKNNNRIHSHIFDLKKNQDLIKFNKSPTLYELFSIKEAFKVFNLKQYNFIIKITGRYYIPNIESIIKNLNNKNTFYIQYRNLGKKHFGTEILIFKSNIFYNIYNYTLSNNLILEKGIYNLCKYNVYSRIPKINLEKIVYRGGDNMKMIYL